MEPTVTAVIVAYWPRRIPALQSLVDSLQDEPFDDIIVFNNNKRHHLEIEGATVINSEGNFTSRSKYAVALLKPSDYYLLIDDDVLDLPGMLDAFMAHARPGIALCTHGQRMTTNFYHQGTMIRDVEISELEPVDGFMGILQFVSFGAIVRMLEAEEKIRLKLGPDWRYVAEDIFVAMSNPGNAFIIPRTESETCHWNVRTDVGETKEAMQHDHGYLYMRDMFAYQAWLALGHSSFAGLKPGSQAELEGIDYYVKLLKDRDDAD